MFGSYVPGALVWGIVVFRGGEFEAPGSLLMPSSFRVFKP